MKQLNKRYKGYLYIGVIIASMLLLSSYHLDGSFGDSLFRAVGLSPWTGDENTGLHIPVIIGIPLLLAGIISAVSVYRERYPKIGSILVISCIVFALIFGTITSSVMFLVKRNAVDATSVDIANGKCQFRSDDGELLKLICTFTVYNYGKVEQIEVTPIIPEEIQTDGFPAFHANQLDISKRKKATYTTQFTVTHKNDSQWSGSLNEAQFDVKVLRTG
ncbi:hypothetical protein ACX93W_15245 [Paenibacillus sp. CAU 1782]